MKPLTISVELQNFLSDRYSFTHGTDGYVTGYCLTKNRYAMLPEGKTYFTASIKAERFDSSRIFLAKIYYYEFDIEHEAH